jgi:hypothetical protein
MYRYTTISNLLTVLYVLPISLLCTTVKLFGINIYILCLMSRLIMFEIRHNDLKVKDEMPLFIFYYFFKCIYSIIYTSIRTFVLQYPRSSRVAHWLGSAPGCCMAAPGSHPGAAPNNGDSFSEPTANKFVMEKTPTQ